MRGAERKAAISAYKERAPAYGVFAVICRATGEAWVGRSRHVDTHKNGLWFSLRQGGARPTSLQSAFAAHGDGAFSFEELERLRADFPALGVEDELKRRQALWRERLQAHAL